MKVIRPPTGQGTSPLDAGLGLNCRLELLVQKMTTAVLRRSRAAIHQVSKPPEKPFVSRIPLSSRTSEFPYYRFPTVLSPGSLWGTVSRSSRLPSFIPR